MTLSYVIFVLSIIVWLLPPFKSVNTRYFYFFVVLGVTDPIRFAIVLLFHYNPPLISILLSGLYVITLLDSRKQQYFVAAFTAVLMVIYYAAAIPIDRVKYFTILFNLGIILIISVRIIDHLKETKSLNLFLALFLAYELITVFRVIAILVNPRLGTVSYMLGGAIQILFGIAFVFININTKSFKLVNERTENKADNLAL
jgi:hypothetical protein